MALRVLEDWGFTGTQVRAERMRRSFKRYVQEAWSKVDPAPLVWSWHLDALCVHLQAVTEGRVKRLLINIPPGHAKSMIVGVLWPTWVWTHKPSWASTFASYELGLVTRDSVKARSLTDGPWYIEHFRSQENARILVPAKGKIPAVTTVWGYTDDQNLKKFYKNTQGGIRQGTSVGSGTGYRSDCFEGSTQVLTEHGPMTIKKLHEMVSKPRVWSLGTQGLELCEVEGSRVIRNAIVGELATVAGSKLLCTDDHRVASGLAYRRAKDINQGHEVYRLSDRALLALQGGDRKANVQCAQATGTEPREYDLLLEGVRSCAEVRLQAVSRVLEGDTVQQGPQVLLKGVLAFDPAREASARVPTMQHGVQPQGEQAHVLLSSVCERGAPLAHVGVRQLSLQESQQLLAMVQADVSLDPRPRSASLQQLSLPRLDKTRLEEQTEVDPRGPSHRRKPDEQHSDQFGHIVRDLSHCAPQIEAHEVGSSWSARDGTHDVYDIQVARNRNFFANGILVHNCLVVDDPLSADQAHSDTERANANRWFFETMSTRFNDAENAVKVIIMQRLHEEDLSGEILRGRGGEYQHLCLPSEYDPGKPSITYTVDGQELWRDPRQSKGELLFPAKFSAQTLKELKVALGSYGYAAQHGQRPSPAEGGMIQKRWFRRRWYAPGEEPITHLDGQELEARLLPERFDFWFIMTDAAFKGSEDSDLVAIGVFARKGPNLYLMDLSWKQMGFLETVSEIKRLRAKWRYVSEIGIEDKANGSAIIETLKANVSGVVPIEPDGGKEVRIMAAAPKLEAGNLWLPMFQMQDRMRDLIEEAGAFPKGRHDDGIDMVAYAINRHLTMSDLGHLEAFMPK